MLPPQTFQTSQARGIGGFVLRVQTPAPIVVNIRILSGVYAFPYLGKVQNCMMLLHARVRLNELYISMSISPKHLKVEMWPLSQGRRTKHGYEYN